ncbi:MAG TPA: DedA family protein [Patescibacteria group bacterium]|nr:DedA family protein [Patescibacteria group bacterium]
MLFNLANLVPWFIQYKYWVIFPIAVVEGPIITIIAGFLASLGYLSLLGGFLTVVLGDLVGDIATYWVGRLGRERFVRKYGHWIGLDWPRVEKMEKYFENHTNSTFIFGKFVHGTGYLMWFATGIAKVPFGKFVSINIVTTAIKSGILILIGYYFGQAYSTFNTYLSNIALILFIGFIILYLIAIKTSLLDKFWQKLEE